LQKSTKKIQKGKTGKTCSCSAKRIVNNKIIAAATDQNMFNGYWHIPARIAYCAQ